jgi:tRNA (guanine-N7-)-methyltransferase
MSPNQLHALEHLVPDLGVPDGVLDVASVFDGKPVAVEIGFGLGDATVEMASADPSTGIIAVEVHTPGIARLALAIERLGLTNVRVLQADAVEFLRDRVPEDSLVEIRAFFPDPWPKTRHHKRRLIRPDLVSLMASRLMSGGVLHVATDWAEYAETMSEVLEREPTLVNAHDGAAPRLGRPLTKFEQTGLDKGHAVTDLVYLRRPR